MKPYQHIPIVDCHEPLVPVPIDQFAVEQLHPYINLAAPYGEKSPYYLRQGALESLIQAQAWLQQAYPSWRVQIFDAYRPIAVQKYMVEYTFEETVRSKGVLLEELTSAEREEILQQVYQFWAVPSQDPKMPPPHSTGAAVDVTLVDATGCPVNMGSPIDEMSPRSYPDYFATNTLAADATAYRDGAMFHANRQILKYAMTAAGFRQHPREWWHFSVGDQLWTWLRSQENAGSLQIARYGAV